MHDPFIPQGVEVSDRWLTTAEVAERYRTVSSTVRYWRHKGTGPQGTSFGRRVLYRESDCERWERQRADADGKPTA